MNHLISKLLVELQTQNIKGYVKIELTNCPTVLKVSLMKISDPIDVCLHFESFNWMAQ